MGLFDLVEEDDAVGAAADGLGELTALVVAQIARRRTQQTGHRVLLLILRHIELEQGFPAAEPALGQRLCQRRLAHAGRPEEEQRPDGPARLPQPRAAAPDGSGHRRHGPALAHHLGVQPLLEAGQTLPLLFAHPLGGHAAGLRHHPGDLLPAQDGVLLPLPLGPDAHRRAGLVHKVDGLVGQAAPRQIPHRKLHRLPQGLVGQADAVVALVAGGQPFQNVHRLLRGRLFDLHPPEAALEGGVLLDVGAELLIRRRADELQLAPGQHRL